MEHLLSQWRREAMPSWRGLMTDTVWHDAPAVVLVDKLGRRNSYEVYVEGTQIARLWRLEDAQAAAEKALGTACTWKRASPQKVNALHYYFGWTTEFTDPVIVYVGTPVLQMEPSQHTAAV